MRSDKRISPTLKNSAAWKKDYKDLRTDTLADSLTDLREIKGDGAGKIASLSGHERNPFFYNQRGKHFENLSLVSGVDSDKDGRAVVLFDYNRDGFLDLALVNANAPKLAIYQNQLGKKLTDNHSVFIRFQGANHTDGPIVKRSNRDGYGCVVHAELGGKILRSEHHCGEGFAAQNSALMHIGIGKAKKIDTLTIRWPSGVLQKLENIPAGSLVTIPEGGEAITAPYKR